MATTEIKILVFAGSLREGSFNKRLATLAAKELMAMGVRATYLDLRDYALPIYDGDIEKTQGLPDNAVKLKALLLEHDGLFIASPEYNASISAALKNTLDWISRPGIGEPPVKSYSGKVAAITGASPGRLGGLRGLFHLRGVLVELGVLVLSHQVAIPQAHEAFADDGSLKNADQAKAVHTLAANLVATISKLQA